MTNINVGMSEIQTSKLPGVILSAPGLGSCIGLTMYDTAIKAAGMVHIVLPDSSINENPVISGKYADKAIPELLNRMSQLGAKKQNLVVKIAGGAQMFNLDKGGNILNIGIRNVIAVKAALNKEGLVLTGSDTGGNKGRTLKLNVATGVVTVRIIGQQELEI